MHSLHFSSDKTQHNIRVLSADLSVLELTIQPKMQFNKLGVELKNFCFHGKTRRSILFGLCFICCTVNKQSRSGLLYRPYWKDSHCLSGLKPLSIPKISNRLGQMELKRTVFQLRPAFSFFPLWAIVTSFFMNQPKWLIFKHKLHKFGKNLNFTLFCSSAMLVSLEKGHIKYCTQLGSLWLCSSVKDIDKRTEYIWCIMYSLQQPVKVSMC